MKNIFLLVVMIFTFGMVNAQITDVERDGSCLKIYDSNGLKTSMSICSNCELAGYNSKRIVVLEEYQLKVYDSSGKWETTFSISSGCKVKNVSEKYILIKDGHQTKYFDFKGKWVKTI